MTKMTNMTTTYATDRSFSYGPHNPGFASLASRSNCRNASRPTLLYCLERLASPAGCRDRILTPVDYFRHRPLAPRFLTATAGRLSCLE
jgi:hypothetical protein